MDTLTTLPPSPDGLRLGPARAVTAPQLAQALERLPPKHRLRFADEIEERNPSQTPVDAKLNDLVADSKRHYHEDRRGDNEHTGSESGFLTPYSTTSEPHKPPPINYGFPKAGAWQTYFMQEVAGDKYLEAQLLLMTIVTGALDAMTYTTYSVFASKQTGNTLFLAIYAMRLPAVEREVEMNVGVSIGVFICGAAFFGHVGHISRQRRRIWLLVSNTFQAILVLAAAAMQYWVSTKRTGPAALGVLAVLSFAASGQIANALSVSMPELNTTMITGALIQLCTDRQIFRLHNAKRNRRLAFFSAMLIGCFLGAAVLKIWSPSAVLVLVASMKGALVLSFLANRGIVDKKSRLEDGNEKVEGHVTPVTQVLWGN